MIPDRGILPDGSAFAFASSNTPQATRRMMVNQMMAIQDAEPEVKRRGKGMTPKYENTCANILELPSEHPDFIPYDTPFECKPGVLACQLYPGRERSKGGVLLPTNGGGLAPGSEGAAAERVRPDCAIVLDIGGQLPLEDLHDAEDYSRIPEAWHAKSKKRHSARLLANSLVPGDRIMLRPWSGSRYATAYGIPGLAFIGNTDPWEEDVILRLSGGRWRPLNNWVMVRFDPIWKGAEGCQLVSAANILDLKGTILDLGPLAFLKTITHPDGTTETIQTKKPGDRVIASDDMMLDSIDDVKWLTTKWGEWGDDVWLIREVDCDNTRRVVALIED